MHTLYSSALFPLQCWREKQKAVEMLLNIFTLFLGFLPNKAKSVDFANFLVLVVYYQFSENVEEEKANK